MLIHDIKEGKWGKVDGKWYVRPPGRKRAARLSRLHTVYIEKDAAITVTPSIVFSTPDREDYWHGYLTHGQWQVLQDGKNPSLRGGGFSANVPR
jgi:hypothetical protein